MKKDIIFILQESSLSDRYKEDFKSRFDSEFSKLSVNSDYAIKDLGYSLKEMEEIVSKSYSAVEMLSVVKSIADIDKLKINWDDTIIDIDLIKESLEEGDDFKVGLEQEIEYLWQEYYKFRNQSDDLRKYIKEVASDEVRQEILEEYQDELGEEFIKVFGEDSISIDMSKYKHSFYYNIEGDNYNIKVRLSDHTAPLGGGSKWTGSYFEQQENADVDIELRNDGIYINEEPVVLKSFSQLVDYIKTFLNK